MTTLESFDAAHGALGGRLSGPVFLPGQAGYDEEIAPFNLATTHSPAIAVGAENADDVVAAVRFAAEHELAVGVQATGHGAVCPVDGLLISTRRMQDLHIDPVGRTATLAAGVKWSTVVEAAAPYGLAPLVGSASDVGAVGYTLGGGLPILGRAYGLAADHVRSLEVVTADGVLHRADPEHDADLFWALLGSKGNLGVVTSMTIGLVPVSRLYGGGVFYPGSAASDVLHAYRTWSAGLSEQTCTSVALLRLPPMPDIPEPLRGQFVVHLRVAHLGDAAEGERLLAPMRAVAPAIVDTVTEMPYTAIDAIHQDPDHPLPSYERGALLHELPEEAIETLLAIAGPDVQVPVLLVELRQLGGALARPPAVSNASGGRDAAFSLFAVGVLMPEIAAIVPSAVDGLIAAFAPHATGGTLVNFHGIPGDHLDRARPWMEEAYTRLCDLKATYDPANTFRFGHGIPAQRRGE